MAITIIILEFLFFSFIGWILDSAYRSIEERNWINAGYFKGPFCPIYGVGGVILIYLFKNMAWMPLALQLLIASMAMITVEYAGGVFSERILKVKLWDYSSSRFHIGGYIDLLHSFFWMLLSIMFYVVFYPLVLLLEPMVTVPVYLDVFLLLISVAGGIWLTLRKAPVKFLDIHGKMINLTVYKYREIYSLIRKMYRSSSRTAQQELQRLIAEQLKNTNATLKKLHLWKR